MYERIKVSVCEYIVMVAQHSTKLEQVGYFKYLNVFLDEKFTWVNTYLIFMVSSGEVSGHFTFNGKSVTL